VASTVIDCTDESFRILRAGAITEEQIRAVLKQNT
jgi:tRNA A37 threonylcarbamoyladenosine synthetase subunit TsaC/SUA5/YrdC